LLAIYATQRPGCCVPRQALAALYELELAAPLMIKLWQDIAATLCAAPPAPVAAAAAGAAAADGDGGSSAAACMAQLQVRCARGQRLRVLHSYRGTTFE
jgi:hypothetical protein